MVSLEIGWSGDNGSNRAILWLFSATDNVATGISFVACGREVKVILSRLQGGQLCHRVMNAAIASLRVAE